MVPIRPARPSHFHPRPHLVLYVHENPAECVMTCRCTASTCSECRRFSASSPCALLRFKLHKAQTIQIIYTEEAGQSGCRSDCAQTGRFPLGDTATGSHSVNPESTVMEKGSLSTDGEPMPRSFGKSKPKSGILLAQRQALAALRNITFFSLEELNAAIADRVKVINRTPFQKLSGSCQSMFEADDKLALRPLPVAPYA